MALMTDVLENDLANHIFRNMKYDSPIEIWLGLFDSNPKDEMKNSEIIGNGYVRELVRFDSPQNGLIKNADKIIFPHATNQWNEVRYVALFDSGSGGSMLFHGQVESPVIIGKNKNFVIKMHDLHVGFE